MRMPHYYSLEWNRVPHQLVIIIESYQRRHESIPILRGSVWIKELVSPFTRRAFHAIILGELRKLF
jgi:hypothetical protein